MQFVHTNPPHRPKFYRRPYALGGNLTDMATIAGRDSMELPGQLQRNALTVKSQKLPLTFTLNAKPLAFPAYELESKLTRPEHWRPSRDPPSLNGNVCSLRTFMR